MAGTDTSFWEKTSNTMQWDGFLPKKVGEWTKERVKNLDGVSEEMMTELRKVDWEDPKVKNKFTTNEEIEFSTDGKNHGQKAAIAYKKREDGTFSCMYLLVEVTFVMKKPKPIAPPPSPPPAKQEKSVFSKLKFWESNDSDKSRTSLHHQSSTGTNQSYEGVGHGAGKKYPTSAPRQDESRDKKNKTHWEESYGGESHGAGRRDHRGPTGHNESKEEKKKAAQEKEKAAEEERKEAINADITKMIREIFSKEGFTVEPTEF